MGSLTVRQLSPTIGAEVEGVDLSVPLSPENRDAILQLFLDHHVLFFREKYLEKTKQLEFAQYFGEIAQKDQVGVIGGRIGDVQILDTVGASTERGTNVDNWHTDITFLSHPYKATLLSAQIIPEVGGDTLWSNLHYAYELLSSKTQQLTDGLEARHSWPVDYAGPASKPEHYEGAIHPVVRVHPETGRKCLFVNDWYTRRIIGMTPIESRSLLNLLTETIKSPEAQCRFPWTTGALAIWDNRCTAHYGVVDYQSRRVMHRVAVAGDKPIAPAIGNHRPKHLAQPGHDRERSKAAPSPAPPAQARDNAASAIWRSGQDRSPLHRDEQPRLRRQPHKHAWSCHLRPILHKSSSVTLLLWSAIRRLRAKQEGGYLNYAVSRN